MPQLRQNPITGGWVIIATERAKRPSDFVQAEEKEEKKAALDQKCPFCPGQEKATPPEVWAYREGGEVDGPGWKVRVVPNKFAALSRQDELEKWEKPPFITMNGVGTHEVIIESPAHDRPLDNLAPEQAELVLLAWWERYRVLREERNIRYTQIFRNQGRKGGASLAHPHCQLIATPLIPLTVENELKGAATYREKYQTCVYCSLLEHEAREKERLVWENKDYVLLCPYFSRFPFETWILPKNHAWQFGSLKPPDLPALAEAVQQALNRLTTLIEGVSYNLILHTAPYDREAQGYHWHLELLPRLTTVAGFEWGTGWFINPTPPEAAAEALREIF